MDLNRKVNQLQARFDLFKPAFREKLDALIEAKKDDYKEKFYKKFPTLLELYKKRLKLLEEINHINHQIQNTIPSFDTVENKEDYGYFIKVYQIMTKHEKEIEDLWIKTEIENTSSVYTSYNSTYQVFANKIYDTNETIEEIVKDYEFCIKHMIGDEKFDEFLNSGPIISVDGRVVDIEYLCDVLMPGLINDNQEAINDSGANVQDLSDPINWKVSDEKRTTDKHLQYITYVPLEGKLNVGIATNRSKCLIYETKLIYATDQ